MKLFVGMTMIATMLVFLTGCPSARQPKPYVGTDINRIARYDYAGIPVAQVQESRPYVHLEVLFGRLPGMDRGLEAIILEAVMLGGTGDLDPYVFALKMESAGGILDLVEREGYVSLRLRCLPEDLKESFLLMSQLLIHPQLEESVVSGVVAEHKALMRASENSPELAAEMLLREFAFAGTPSARSSSPSPSTLAISTPASLHRLAVSEMFIRCNMGILVAGPVDAEMVGDLLFGTIDQLPEGDCPAISEMSVTTGLVAMEHRPEGIEAITAALPAPGPGSPDAFVMDAAARILDAQARKRVVEQLRIAVNSEIRYVALPPAHLRITMTGPRMVQSAELVLSEIRKMKENGIRETALDSAKRWMLSEQQMALESSSNWAQQAAMSVLTGGWGGFGNPQERIEALSPSHLQYVMEKYATGISWGFVGDTTRIDRRTLLRF